MQTIDVTTGAPYRVHVGTMLLEKVGDIARDAKNTGIHAVIVTDANVGPLYAQILERSLSDSGYQVSILSIPAGEASKIPSTYLDIIAFIAEHGLDRKDLVVALGGGVVGDMAGFAAATYMRGIDYIQVPTSLLAMVDSSVGGKTAVDLPQGKNLLGAFWQPIAVIADIGCLATLSAEQFADGAGEVVKHGAIADAELFSVLERQPATLAELMGNVPYISSVVARNVAIKRNVVQEDEREAGLRQTLNFGHTLGHAVESLSDYTLGHGSCVSIGMCLVARACTALGICAAGIPSRIEETCRAHGLPTESPYAAERIYERALADKKRRGDAMNVVLIEDIGRVRIESLPLSSFRELIELGCA